MPSDDFLDMLDEMFERKILSEADKYIPGKDQNIINVIKKYIKNEKEKTKQNSSAVN
jgi:septum formation topological specificity factor MinE